MAASVWWLVWTVSVGLSAAWAGRCSLEAQPQRRPPRRMTETGATNGRPHAAPPPALRCAAPEPLSNSGDDQTTLEVGHESASREPMPHFGRVDTVGQGTRSASVDPIARRSRHGLPMLR